MTEKNGYIGIHHLDLGTNQAAAPAFRTSDERVAEAARLPQIIAAAKSWRKRLENASTGSSCFTTPNPIVAQKLTPAELEAFEQALTLDFASTKAFLPQAEMFMPEGLDVTISLGMAASAAGIRGKIVKFGFLSRMRILDDSVDHEIDAYRSYKWENAWRKATEPSTAAA